MYSSPTLALKAGGWRVFTAAPVGLRQTEVMAGWARAVSSERVDKRDRFERVWASIFHIVLGVPTAVSLATSGFDPVRWTGLVAGVAAIAGARHLAVRELARIEGDSRRRLTLGLMWAAVTLANVVLLVRADEVFVFAIYGLFPQTFMILPRNWAIGFSAALVPGVLLGAEGLAVLEDSLASIVGSAVLAPAIGMFIHAIGRQSEERHQAILALQAAQVEAQSLLVATLAVSRARTPDEVVEAVGHCLSAHGVEAVAIDVGGTRVAVWHRPDPAVDGAEETPARRTTTVTLDGPGPDDVQVALEASGTSDLSAGSRQTLEALATSCGLALANLRLVEQARESGVEHERARLAREIHDTLAQGFVSVLTQLEAAHEPLSRAPAEVVERVQRASAIARASLGEARRSVHALRPAALEAASLSEAIERVVARWSDEAAVGASVTLTGTAAPLAPSNEVTLLRATQEALANVARHARATTVTVTLSFLGDAVVLDVHDDGQGFDADGPRNGSGGGFGLEALRQRVAASGGYFGLESEPGRGTTVTVHIPLAVGSSS